MAFVLFKLRTGYVTCDTDDVYEIPDEDVYNEDGSVDTDFLDEVAEELAVDNADSYGLFDEDEDEEDDGVENDVEYGFEYVILNGTREEIEEDYGSICNL